MAVVSDVRVAVSVAEEERGGMMASVNPEDDGALEVEVEGGGALLLLVFLWFSSSSSGVKAVIVRQVPFTEMESPREASERISGQDVMVSEVPWPPVAVDAWGGRRETTGFC